MYHVPHALQVADKMTLTRPPSGDVDPHGQLSGGGPGLAHETLTVLDTSTRDDDEEEKLNLAKERAKLIGAGRARRAKRVT